MEFGLHIADFTWTTGPEQLGPSLARHVRNAEAAGIQRITVMDHFWQLPALGGPDDDRHWLSMAILMTPDMSDSAGNVHNFAGNVHGGTTEIRAGTTA